MRKHKNKKIPKGRIKIESLPNMISEGMSDQDMSFRKLADKVGISASFLCRFIMGERSAPADSTLLKIAEVLKIEPTEILIVLAGRIPKKRRKLVELLEQSSFLTDEELEPILRKVREISYKKRGYR